MRGLAALALLLLALASTPAMAHQAGPAPEAYRRVADDDTDDCGPESANDCRGAMDLVALDLAEAWRDGRDVVVFRFTLDRGEQPTAIEVTLQAPDGPRTLRIRTADGAAFTAEAGFVAVGPAATANDGTRVIVEAVAERASLGGVGAKLTGLKVESRTAAVGDTMPGGCSNTLGPCVSDGRGNASTYTLRGPGYYLQVTPPTSIQAAAGQPASAPVRLENLLPRSAQRVHVAIEGDAPAGLVRGSDGDPAAAARSLDIDLAGKGTATVVVRLAADAPATGTLRLVATTDLGGRTEAVVPYEVTASDRPDTGAGTTSAREAGAPPAALLACLLAAVAAARLAPRRRA